MATQRFFIWNKCKEKYRNNCIEATKNHCYLLLHQTGPVGEEENDQLTSESSDTDYFGDVETSSSKSSQSAASDSDDDVSEVFYKGNIELIYSSPFLRQLFRVISHPFCIRIHLLKQVLDSIFLVRYVISHAFRY